MLPDHGMYCEMQLLSLLDFSFTVSLFLVILTLFFNLLEKYLKITHKRAGTYTPGPLLVLPPQNALFLMNCAVIKSP